MIIAVLSSIPQLYVHCCFGGFIFYFIFFLGGGGGGGEGASRKIKWNRKSQFCEYFLTPVFLKLAFDELNGLNIRFLRRALCVRCACQTEQNFLDLQSGHQVLLNYFCCREIVCKTHIFTPWTDNQIRWDATINTCRVYKPLNHWEFPPELDRLLRSSSLVTAGARPTNCISTEFEIR